MNTQIHTRKLIKMLQDHPEVVLRIFHLNGKEAVPYTGICKQVSTEMSQYSWWQEISYHAIRRILHRESPFNLPEIYSKVSPELNELVVAKFRGVKVKIPTKKIEKEVRTSSVERGNRWNLFSQAMSAARDYKNALERYEAALDAAEETGMVREDLHRLSCDAVELLESELNNET